MERYPLIYDTMTQLPSVPATIIDCHGAILVWYLPEVLSLARQVGIVVLMFNSEMINNLVGENM